MTEEDFVVIMTNGHMHDFQVEEQILRGPFAYVGVIGSRTKTASVNRRLREAGIPEESIAQVHTPIGTAIQAVTPAEIAVSIAGQSAGAISPMAAPCTESEREGRFRYS